jgi:hypothetical protein
MLSVIMLSVIMLSVVAPLKHLFSLYPLTPEILKNYVLSGSY